MLWIIRAGKDAVFFDKYIEKERIYVPWNGYNFDLKNIKERNKFRKIVEKEKQTTNLTSISNWSGQLYSFVEEMKVGDNVLIPTKGSHTYTLATIIGDYEYDKSDIDELYHSRPINIIRKDIPRDIFSQTIIYSLGAFRTLFKSKHEEEIFKTIEVCYRGGKR